MQKFVSLKASYHLIRRTRVPNLGEVDNLPSNHKRIVTEFKKLQIQRKNKTMFIPDKAHKQNLPPYQHKVCTPILNISHILSILLHCGLQGKDQYGTHNQLLVLSSNRHRREQLGQCPNLMECRTELDPGKPFTSCG